MSIRAIPVPIGLHGHIFQSFNTESEFFCLYPLLVVLRKLRESYIRSIRLLAIVLVGTVNRICQLQCPCSNLVGRTVWKRARSVATTQRTTLAKRFSFDLESSRFGRGEGWSCRRWHWPQLS